MIWENLHIYNFVLFKNKLKITLIVVLSLLAILVVFTYLKQNATNSLLGFPPTTDCKSFNRLFENIAEYLKYAEFDKAPTLALKGTGVYQCYCERKGDILDALDSTNFCYEYYLNSTYVAAFTNGVTLIIGILNIVVRFINLSLIKKIGYNYES